VLRAGWRVAVVAPTIADARKVCIEGESGILRCLPPNTYKWNRSLGELTLANGSQIATYSAEEPARLRGPQHHMAWCDELACWKYQQETWDMLMFGLRLGQDPRVIVTTTPRATPTVKAIVADTGTHTTRGTTFENRQNLAPSWYASILQAYEGTRLGRQELLAEILEDVEGALWSLGMIEANRVREAPALVRVVVGVDPAASSGAASDETGIVVAGLGEDGHGYVLEDASGRCSPQEWAARAVDAYERHQADRIVAEANNGGEMVAATIRTINSTVPITLVHASRGKALRAEPIVSLDEQGRIHHVGTLPRLEDQMTSWSPSAGGRSPDRVDARVWALTELMLRRARPQFGMVHAEERVSPWVLQ
jgi:phage terminase large subunit-like protein